MIVYFILLTHWVGDFVLQTRWMGDNKSKRLSALLLHVVVYTLTLLFGAFLLEEYLAFTLSETSLLLFVFLNGVIHMMVDFVTSRLTSYFYSKKQIHLFFTIIGFDQMIHTATLLGTANWLLNAHS